MKRLWEMLGFSALAGARPSRREIEKATVAARRELVVSVLKAEHAASMAQTRLGHGVLARVNESQRSK